jgi:hypothetical protein
MIWSGGFPFQSRQASIAICRQLSSKVSDAHTSLLNYLEKKPRKRYCDQMDSQSKADKSLR